MESQHVFQQQIEQNKTSVIILGKEYDIKTTTELNLCCEQLKELPKELGNLTNLQYLYIDYNQLKELPEELVNLTNLQELYISSNQLKELPILNDQVVVYGMSHQKITDINNAKNIHFNKKNDELTKKNDELIVGVKELEFQLKSHNKNIYDEYEIVNKTL